jgi:DNA-binding transcriptional LysR family regulator
MDRLKAMETFVRVVDAGSFSSAASQMGVSNGLLSKHIMKLETLLGARLLNRTTRQINVTKIGREYHDFCVRILNDIRNQEATIADLQSDTRGELKVLVAKGFGSLHMGDAVSQFMRMYPDIQINLTLRENSFVRSHEIIENGYDVAIRWSKMEKDSAIIARRLGTLRWVVCAAPRYLEGKLEPEEPKDLEGHKILVTSRHAPDGFWRYNDGASRTPRKIAVHMRANSLIVLREAALQGQGIALLPTYCVGRDLQRGALRRVAQHLRTPDQPIYAIFPYRQLLPRKVRVFVDFMGKRLRKASWEEDGPDLD